MAKSKKRKRPAPAAGAPKAAAGAPKAPPKPRRDERIAAERAARRRRSLLIRSAVVAAVVVLAGVVAVLQRDRSAEVKGLVGQLTAGSCRYDTKSDPTDAPPGNHVSEPTYEVEPPAGGNHLPAATGAGTYSGSAVPPDGQLVHSLEHGYVVIWARPDLSEGELGEVMGVQERYERDVVMVTRPGLDVKVAATAWGKRLLCGEVEPGPLATFVDTYRNKGPERIPH